MKPISSSFTDLLPTVLESDGRNDSLIEFLSYFCLDDERKKKLIDIATQIYMFLPSVQDCIHQLLRVLLRTLEEKKVG